MTTTGGPDMAVSESLALAVVKCNQSPLPDIVRERATTLIFDAVGVAIAGSAEESSKVVLATLQNLDESTRSGVLGTDVRLSPPNAALANGAMIHALDYDDTQLPAQVHVSGSVVAAAVATAEDSNCSGRDLVQAVALGAEVAYRVGASAPGRFNENGFHATGVCGAFGAAAAAGVLLGCDAAQLAHAFGVVGSFASGLMAFLDSPDSWIKRLHSGWAAHSGVLAANFARNGLTGARNVFGGRFGLYKTHTGSVEPDLTVLLDNWGSNWQMLQLGLKPYPTGHFNIPFVTAAISLREHPSFSLEDVESIVCEVPPDSIETVCEPLAEKRRPPSGYAGKFSLPFSIAVALVDGAVGLSSFTDEAVRNDQLLSVASLVDYVPYSNTVFPNGYDGRLTINLRNGEVLTQTETHALGHPSNPMTAQDVEKKFRDCVSRRLDPKEADSLVEWLLRIEEQSALRPLIDLTAPRP